MLVSADMREQATILHFYEARRIEVQIKRIQSSTKMEKKGFKTAEVLEKE